MEIYKGKPIFYGVSNFVFQSAIMPEGKGSLPPVPGQEATREGRGGPGGPGFGPNPGGRGRRGGTGNNDAIVGEHENQGFWQLRANLEALLASARYQNGQLTEVRIYPMDLGQTARVGTQLGVPKRPSPEVAKAILDEVIEYSKPFGTKIVVENGVGIIRVPTTTTH